MSQFSLSLLMIVAVSATAAAEPANAKLVKPVKAGEVMKNKKVKHRVFNASATKLGCTDHHQTSGISCEGIERYRSGMGANSTAYMVKKNVGAVAMYQVTSAQAGGLVASQAIAAVGVRKVIGGGWIQGGPGIARIGVGPGPKSIGTLKAMAEPRAALAGGVGMNVGNSDEPASLALDFGTTVDSKANEPQIYQVNASVVQRF